MTLQPPVLDLLTHSDAQLIIIALLWFGARFIWTRRAFGHGTVVADALGKGLVAARACALLARRRLAVGGADGARASLRAQLGAARLRTTRRPRGARRRHFGRRALLADAFLEGAVLRHDPCWVEGFSHVI